MSEEVQAEAFLAINGRSKKAKIVTNEGNQEGGQTISSSSLRGMNQSTMPEFSRQKKKKCTWTNFLLSISYKTILYLINVLQISSFKEYVRAVAGYGPSYKLPSY